MSKASDQPSRSEPGDTPILIRATVIEADVQICTRSGLKKPDESGYLLASIPEAFRQKARFSLQQAVVLGDLLILIGFAGCAHADVGECSNVGTLELESPSLGSSLSLLYGIRLVIYRLYLSPLSKFPGSKLAAMGLWYEFYYEAIQDGQYTFKIRDWHEKYGPIIRINPHELHISDPDFYSVVFSGAACRDKYEWYCAQFGTVSHDLHRLRRQALSPLFSKASITRLQPVMASLVEKFCARVQDFKISGQPVNNHLDSADFSPMWCETVKNTAAMTKWTKQFPWLFPIFKALPDKAVGVLNPGLLLVLNIQHNVKRQIQDIMDGKVAKEDVTEDGLPRTIFHELLKSDLPEQIKVVTTFYLLNSPDKLRKLKYELESAILDKFTVPELALAENPPVLSEVINEGLRLSYGVSTHLTHIAPDEDLQFKNEQ
ncbi:hypothetical protein G7Y89_g6036 [Cudoniella acicularis]|uniref:Cytochrome P450 n=1 Tax=Cudoniella acicularis TaxID=354080 RepID=A0A8H4RNP0_9HELO|nr:hypothetical protein G7Y89_g6036 [Cudoniella acicularis]